jgi:hypothetical protein
VSSANKRLKDIFVIQTRKAHLPVLLVAYKLREKKPRIITWKMSKSEGAAEQSELQWDAYHLSPQFLWVGLGSGKNNKRWTVENGLS